MVFLCAGLFGALLGLFFLGGFFGTLISCSIFWVHSRILVYDHLIWSGLLWVNFRVVSGGLFRAVLVGEFFLWVFFFRVRLLGCFLLGGFFRGPFSVLFLG